MKEQLGWACWSPVTFIWGLFPERYPSHHSWKQIESYLSKISFNSIKGQWVNVSYEWQSSLASHCRSTLSTVWLWQDLIAFLSIPRQSHLMNMISENTDPLIHSLDITTKTERTDGIYTGVCFKHLNVIIIFWHYVSVKLAVSTNYLHSDVIMSAMASQITSLTII